MGKQPENLKVIRYFISYLKKYSDYVIRVNCNALPPTLRKVGYAKSIYNHHTIQKGKLL